MNVKFTKSEASGTLFAPPSKSMAHRYIICGALQKGVTTVKNVALSADIKATLRAVTALNAEYTYSDNTLTVTGVKPTENPIIDCGESGSTLRFFIPIVLTLCKKAKFVGSKRLFERPLTVYEELFIKNGIAFKKGDGFLEVDGSFLSSDFTVDGSISSQFISGLLFALPLMGGGSITIKNGLESTPYIDMTLKALSEFGIKTERTENGFKVSSTEYKPCEITVEGDYSNAAFLDGFNLLGGKITVAGLSENSLQGDKVYKQYFKELQNGFATLDITDCPDLGPVLFALAAANDGAKFLGTRRLKIKESDRAEVMKEELAKFSVKVELDDNFATVASGLKPPKCPLNSHNDHRIAMALSLLCTKTGGTVLGAEAVNKSYPDFFEVIKTAGIKYEIDE